MAAWIGEQLHHGWVHPYFAHSRDRCRAGKDHPGPVGHLERTNSVLPGKTGYSISFPRESGQRVTSIAATQKKGGYCEQT